MRFVTFFKGELISDSICYLMHFTILFSHAGIEYSYQVLLLFLGSSSGRSKHAQGSQSRVQHSLLLREDINNPILPAYMARKLEETNRVHQIIGPYYCQSALRLCIEARALYASGEGEKAAKICGFVSTLCSENKFKTCTQESSLCAQVAECCLKGQSSVEFKKGSEICVEARKLCPQNNVVAGA
ncbi:hypothetical protein MUP77_19200 [Candidatus Bathyarchaeota archaeon]|nr:hypothetical protein [Candidatus Bathyarchaeota archaeon]